MENQIKDRDLLMHVLEDVPRTLTPVRKLEILPGETKLLYVLLTVDGQVRSTVQGRLQKQTAKVNIPDFFLPKSIQLLCTALQKRVKHELTR